MYRDSLNTQGSESNGQLEEDFTFTDHSAIWWPAEVTAAETSDRKWSCTQPVDNVQTTICNQLNVDIIPYRLRLKEFCFQRYDSRTSNTLVFGFRTSPGPVLFSVMSVLWGDCIKELRVHANCNQKCVLALRNFAKSQNISTSREDSRRATWWNVGSSASIASVRWLCSWALLTTLSVWTHHYAQVCYVRTMWTQC